MSRSWSTAFVGLGLTAVLIAGCGDKSQPETAKAPPLDAAVAPPDARQPPDADIPAPLAGHDFIVEARLLASAAACAPGELPPELDAKVVASHCRWLEKRKQKYRAKYVGEMGEFIATILPTERPAAVVYPFGGGDLVSALVAFPDAVEITTMSLELTGDPRPIVAISKRHLRDSLEALRPTFGALMAASNNTSKNLSAAQTNVLPTQLEMFLLGLEVNDFEPISLRYFRIEPDGQLHYFTAAEISELDGDDAAPLKGDWQRPSFAAVFSNCELRYRRRGGGEGEPVRIHRHIAANISDKNLPPGLLPHLEAKSKISAMTKAATYLLWRDNFSEIRNYLLGHMEVMLSDSTGIPPRFTDGFEQITYGKFQSSFLDANERDNRDFRKLWQSQPYRAVPRRFGYIDASRRAHLLVTRRQ